MRENTYLLEYDGKEYFYREIFFEGRWNFVSTTELSQALLTPTSEDWVSDEARIIDEKIIFYVAPDEISLPSAALLSILHTNIY